MTGKQGSVPSQPDGDFTHGINPFGDGLDRELHQLVGNPGQIIQSSTHRVHRSGPNG